MGYSHIDDAAKVVWDYLQLNQEIRPGRIIICLCSLDTRVAERAAQLYLADYGKKIVFSGKLGKLTQGKFYDTEARTFAVIANRMNVPWEDIHVEDESTNTGENIIFTYKLLEQKELDEESFILVQKPYMERRAYATFLKQWPGKYSSVQVTSPKIAYKDYFDANNPKDLVLNVMAGDLQRIREYPKLGLQEPQDIPSEVWSAYEMLIAAGYDKHLIS